MSAATETVKNLNIKEYFEILINLMRHPAVFFADVAGETGTRRAWMFLFISALFYASVSMSYFFESSLQMGVVMMANGLLMPLLATLFTYILVGMFHTERIEFARIFNIYAYATGAMMVVSWIPGLAIVLEPVRALLVGVGLVKACGLGKLKAASMVVATAFLLLMFFWTLAPVVMELRALLA
ncbi:YIP1 family protein [Pseudodesulfovibrio tunisiensis]|uniref:YIP1 family protein n=1 Tax=Pseudodesulfovibrio tunisiensis TaxID=463192 RepID=UPI001FB4F623|nr:YIP1 family protein [Pseudodesulfovibrio tunisiensis]